MIILILVVIIVWLTFFLIYKYIIYIELIFGGINPERYVGDLTTFTVENVQGNSYKI